MSVDTEHGNTGLELEQLRLDAARFRAMPALMMAIIWRRSAADLPPLGNMKKGFDVDDLRTWIDAATDAAMKEQQ